MLGQVLHVDLTVWRLTNLQATLRSLDRINEQVLDALIVNLQHTELHLELLVFIGVQFDAFENFIARDGNNALVGTIADLSN